MFNDLLNEFLSLIPGRVDEREKTNDFLSSNSNENIFFLPFRQREKKINYFKFVGFFLFRKNFVFFSSFFLLLSFVLCLKTVVGFFLLLLSSKFSSSFAQELYENPFEPSTASARVSHANPRNCNDPSQPAECHA
jgi:hypothetical protein